MPRLVESHLLSQRVPSPKRARLHLCGSNLVVAEADFGGPWRRGLFPHPDLETARRERERLLTVLYRTGYHLVTSQRFTVPAVLAARCGGDLGVFDEPFAAAWAAGWAPALTALRDAVATDGGRRRHLVLLVNFPHHTAESPWGAPLVEALAESPQALHAETGLLLVGVGPTVLTWLHTYYATALEQTPRVLPAEDGDTDLTYTFALHVWQPTLEGPLAQLAEALETARDLSAAGVPL